MEPERKEVTEEEKRFAKTFRIDDLDDIPPGLPPHLELQRTRVLCKEDAPIHTEGITYSGAYISMGVDNSVDITKFRQNFKIDAISFRDEGMTMQFDMIGIDAAMANAFRRILIAEVPSMAIEHVYIANNTSIIQDEVLASRLGLIPLAADPRLFEYLSENDQPNEKNTIVFKLHAKCARGEPRLKVKTDEMKWLPNGSELVKESGGSSAKPKTYTSFSRSQDSFPEFADNPIAPSYSDILIAKLGPGQEIDLEAHAIKGIGKTHAKWSPVAPAYYKMLPEVVLHKEFEGEHAQQLVESCPAKVFDLEDMGEGRKRATVARPRDCTLCRECLTEEHGKATKARADKLGKKVKGKRKWVNQVDLRRVRDHFIFTIESDGSLPPDVLFTEAVKILESKCETVISELS